MDRESEGKEGEEERERERGGEREREIDFQLHSEEIVSDCPSIICSSVKEQTCPLVCC